MTNTTLNAMLTGLIIFIVVFFAYAQLIPEKVEFIVSPASVAGIRG